MTDPKLTSNNESQHYFPLQHSATRHVGRNTLVYVPAFLFGSLPARRLKMFGVGIKFPYHGLPRVGKIYLKDYFIMSLFSVILILFLVTLLVFESVIWIGCLILSKYGQYIPLSRISYTNVNFIQPLVIIEFHLVLKYNVSLACLNVLVKLLRLWTC
jgi:hypothetical protein